MKIGDTCEFSIQFRTHLSDFTGRIVSFDETTACVADADPGEATISG